MEPGKPKIYFSGSIRGGREDESLYRELIGFISTLGEVLTKHVGESDPSGDADMPPCRIHDRDMGWLREADLVIAEASVPSLGVGYELGIAVAIGKPVLVLYRRDSEKRLSGIISGSPGIVTVVYGDLVEAKLWIEGFIRQIDKK